MKRRRIIDVHTHLRLGRLDETRGAILDAADRYGYERVYVSTLGGGTVPDSTAIAECNDATAAFMRDFPDYVRGWCYLNPRNVDTMDELRRRIEIDGMAGVKLWVATLCDDPLVNPIAEYCVENSLPIQIHALDKTVGQLEFESKGINVRNLALRYPELRILMAHFGGSEYTGIRAVTDLPNVAIDIGGVISRADTLEYAVERIGVERLLYATDLIGYYACEPVIGRVEALSRICPNAEDIFAANAERLGL